MFVGPPVLCCHPAAAQILAHGGSTQRNDIGAVKTCSIHVLDADEHTGIDPIGIADYCSRCIVHHPWAAADTAAITTADTSRFSRVDKAFGHTRA